MLFRSEIGIHVEIKVLEWGSYLENLKRGTHDMFLLGWPAAAPDPDFALTGVFHSSMAGATNFAFFKDAEVDRMLDDGRGMEDGPDREAVYEAVQQRIDALCPWVYLHNDEQIVGTRRELHGLVLSSRGYHLLTPVTFE